MKIKDLVKVLGTKNQNEDVEFIVVSTKGEIIAMMVEGLAKDIIKALKLFKQ